MRVTAARTTDREDVLAMLGRCSTLTLYRRFHGASDGVAYVADLFGHDPVDAKVIAWDGPASIGLASLARDATGLLHLAALVQDSAQRQGVGTRLVAALVGRAHGGGASTLHADLLGDSHYLLDALRRLGPLRVSIERGALSVDIDLSAGWGPAISPPRPAGTRRSVRPIPPGPA